MSGSDAAAALDTETPNPARVYDHWLGGKEAFAADRELAARVEALYPPGVPGPRELAARNRLFLERAVSSACHDRIGQVLDLGAGFPASRPLHEVAQAARDGARVAYVDIDPRVAAHGQAASERIPGVAWGCADLTRPHEVMACPGVRQVIDLSRPVLVVLGLVMTFMPAGEAERVIAGWADWVPSGSRFVLTVAHWPDEDVWERVRAAYGPALLHNHGDDQVKGMLRGMDLLGCGVVTVRGWCPEEIEPPGPGRILGVVARKP